MSSEMPSLPPAVRSALDLIGNTPLLEVRNLDTGPCPQRPQQIDASRRRCSESSSVATTIRGDVRSCDAVLGLRGVAQLG